MHEPRDVVVNVRSGRLLLLNRTLLVIITVSKRKLTTHEPETRGPKHHRSQGRIPATLDVSVSKTTSTLTHTASSSEALFNTVEEG